MKSSARIGNHPIHPMLILIPAGAFLIVLLCDLLFLVTGDEMWWEATPPDATHGGLVLTLIGNLLIAVSGWLGGTMVYEHHVGVLEHPEARDPDPAVQPIRRRA